jgi:hypothetical protein
LQKLITYINSLSYAQVRAILASGGGKTRTKKSKKGGKRKRKTRKTKRTYKY